MVRVCGLKQKFSKISKTNKGGEKINQEASLGFLFRVESILTHKIQPTLSYPLSSALAEASVPAYMCIRSTSNYYYYLKDIVITKTLRFITI